MSTIEEKLIIGISRLRNILFRDLENIFRQNNLTITQFSVLEVLYHKGSLSVGEIQRLVLGTNGNIPLVIKNLEKEALVSKNKSETDSRVSIIKLTEKGYKVISEVYPKQQERLSELLKNINSDDKQDLTQKLLKAYQCVLQVKEDEIND